ncbi:FliM/FliN family flagellar motor switch protein [Enterobacter cloacae]|uniref:FliM/FliN family flagellar motor switch protein n=1 Tax=Enterobacter cloacae TaxID=550 RepID=UPI002FF6FAEE
MSLKGYLRKRDRHLFALQLLHDRLPGSEIVRCRREERYLHLLIKDDEGNQRQVWMNIDLLLHYMDACLPDIPWLEVPLQYLARWFSHLKLRFTLGERIWRVVQTAVPSYRLPEQGILLPAAPIPLLCFDWPANREEGALESAISTGKIPFELQFVLGFSQLTLAQLVNLTPGDLLLIKEYFTHISIGGTRLYSFTYQFDKVVIVEEKLQRYEKEYREGEIMNEWTNLPVDIEFVLDACTMTLSELEQIMPGREFTLTPDAEQKIKIYLNKKLFARGELVVIENEALAVEVKHVYPTQLSDQEQDYAG